LGKSLQERHWGGVKGRQAGARAPAKIFFFFLGVKQKCELIGTKAVDICRVMRTKG